MSIRSPVVGVGSTADRRGKPRLSGKCRLSPNWEDLASVEFGHDLHRRFRDRCESMSCISRDDHDVSRATSPSVGANRHIDLSRQDVQDLLAMVQVQRSALTSAKLTSRQHDSA